MNPRIDFNLFLRESMTPMHLIEPNLFLGNASAANDENLLRGNRINCIVQCLQNRRMVQHHDFINYLYIDIDDRPTENIGSRIPNAIKFIHRNLKAGNVVLVHCAAGVSRSSSVVIAYMMAKYGLDFDQAKDLVRSKRLCVCPNEGFEHQLRRFRPHELSSLLINI